MEHIPIGVSMLVNDALTIAWFVQAFPPVKLALPTITQTSDCAYTVRAGVIMVANAVLAIVPTALLAILEEPNNFLNVILSLFSLHSMRTMLSRFSVRYLRWRAHMH